MRLDVATFSISYFIKNIHSYHTNYHLVNLLEKVTTNLF